MSSHSALNTLQDLKPPLRVRNMQKLQKDLFVKHIQVPYLTVEPAKVSRIIQPLKKYLLKLERFRPVHEETINDCQSTIIILNPLQIKIFNDITTVDRKTLEIHGVIESSLNWKELTLKFDNYSVEDIFRSVLPHDREGMASFTKVGHIVHVNLRDHLFPYKDLIGEVLLDKVPACRTVINKLNIIDNTYRNFKMEILAGDEDYMVTLKENGCVFELDFATVYWNSRLCTEHERVVKIVKRDDVLFDVFAGVGPFSIPACKNGAVVWANDLNPDSYRWLQHNAKKNKLSGKLHMFNKDGKDFILEDIKRELLPVLQAGKAAYITMNLPALASEFLRYFVGLYSEEDLAPVQNFRAPVVLLYCFAKGEKTEEITRQLIDDCMRRDMSAFVKELFRVRTVSNYKEMMRVKIALGKEILLGKYEGDAVERTASGAATKRKAEPCNKSASEDLAVKKCT